jgi:hypothetical protein
MVEIGWGCLEEVQVKIHTRRRDGGPSGTGLWDCGHGAMR